MKNTFKVLLCVCALSVSGAGAAYAGPVEDAIAAYERKDYATALKIWRDGAELGFSFAQNNLGRMYDNGEGVPENDAEAVKWYRLAADQGNASAQYDLGYMYARGEGVPENFVQAYKWWNLAAAQGNDKAKKSKAVLEEIMTREQIAEAQKLSAEWKPKK